MKKKILMGISLCSFIIMLVGCGGMSVTPTDRVEEYMKKYQDMDSDVLTQLDKIISNDATLTESEKTDYQSLMEKQYQNLSYKIKDETINDDSATVEVEIEVYDYASSISKSDKYRLEHEDEFTKKEDKSSDELYNDYKIKELKDVTETKKETIIFNLTKDNDDWKINTLSDDDISKIHGLYNK